MNQQEQQWFEELTAKRREFRKSILDNNYDEIWNVITSPYSDQAHFIYELLQNADDSGAQRAEFKLYEDKLIFTHNGTRRFSVSNPERRQTKEDAKNGCLGDVNSITGVSNSTKAKDENSIGKFGIGFKSVFIYTDCPHIYDDNMHFKISDFVIPELLQDDYPGREKGTTVFVFPFSSRENAPKNIFQDILDKLKNLIFPTFFLRNLCEIAWNSEAKGEKSFGCYTKTKHNSETFEDRTKIEIIVLRKKIDQELEEKSFILLSRPTALNDNLRYAIGFGLDNGKIYPVNHTAFCYFPTRASTNLNFIIHAPFRLTSDRSNISEASDEHREYNQNLLNNLAGLLADSLPLLVNLGQKTGQKYLNDEFILRGIVPLQIPQSQQWDHLKLDEFYSAPLNKFQSEKIIPCEDGHCTKEHAFSVEYANITQAFNDTDLREFTDDPDAHWIFPNTPIDQGHISWFVKDKIIRPYILKLSNGEQEFSAEDIFSSVHGSFIEKKLENKQWLAKFYNWLSGLSKDLISRSKGYALLLNQDGKATPYLAKNEMQNLFLPIDTNTNFNTVHPDLHSMLEVQALEEAYNMRTPKFVDVINDFITQIQNAATPEVSDVCIKALIGLACNGATSSNDRTHIIENLRNPKIGKFKNQADPPEYLAASELYQKNAVLTEYFKLSGTTRWFIDDSYYAICPDAEKVLAELGVSTKLHIHTQIQNFNGTKAISGLPNYVAVQRCEGERIYDVHTPFIPEMEPILSLLGKIVETGSKDETLNNFIADFAQLIWNALLDIAATCDLDHWHAIFYGHYVYKPYASRHDRIKNFASPLLETLRYTRWIFTTDGEFVSPQETDSSFLQPEYMQHYKANDVCNLLNITVIDDEAIQQAIESLPDTEKQALNLGRMFQQSGITDEEDIKRALELLKNEKRTQNSEPIANISPMPSTDAETTPSWNDVKEKVKEARRKTKEYKERKPHNDIPSTSEKHSPSVQYTDDDVLLPQTIDYAKQIEYLQQKVEDEMAQLQEAAALQETAVTAEEYTYLWLKSRIDLEIKANGAEKNSQKTATVTFAKIEKEEGSANTFILSSPSSEIPLWFEEEVDQPLVLQIPGRNDIRTVIENMSIDAYKLKARIKILPGMEYLDYSKIVQATTSATHPAFLLNSLRDGFINLNLEDEYNLKENLSKNIKFIFGPPGTGKTTYLARKELIPLAQSSEKPHVLVLAPTNKAADVLLKRIILEMGADTSYENWLFRFGHTADDELQDSIVACEKKVNLQEDCSAVVVTTIARFAYDVLMPAERQQIPIASIPWDYIVIDEASMIPLMQILYPLYRVSTAKFIIAGDPMQIEPVVKSDLSKGENIYTMVGLTDFANPITSPYDYEVVRLFTQYRSIPAIGEVFSRFAYSGLLQHNRPETETQSLIFDTIPEIRPLTLLRFPIGKYENIYRIQALERRSCYHVYAALFTFEYIGKLAEELYQKGYEKFRIGIISPYRAQAEIIGRLLSKRKLPNGINVHVGTIHGFQGDECEMIIAMLNPPRGMGKNGTAFINNKKVLNVAISRAKDYLVVMAPSQNTWNIHYLTGPNEIMELMAEKEELFIEYQTPRLEQAIWDDDSYIDRNTYPTGHQNVNVYEQPEKRFEIRASEDAIDVQFRENCVENKPISGENISELARMEAAAEAEERERQSFNIPEGFHRPELDENIPLEKGYYILGRLDECLYHEDVNEEIDMSRVVAIED